MRTKPLALLATSAFLLLAAPHLGAVGQAEARQGPSTITGFVYLNGDTEHSGTGVQIDSVAVPVRPYIVAALLVACGVLLFRGRRTKIAVAVSVVAFTALVSRAADNVISDSTGRFTLTPAQGPEFTPGTYRITYTHEGYEVAYLQVEVHQDDPSTVTVSSVTLDDAAQEVTIEPPADVPDLSDTATTSLEAAVSFLYTGENAAQVGVVEGTIDSERIAVLRGTVTDRNDVGLEGVDITVLAHTEYGSTLSRADGGFDLVVNAGGPLVIRYEKNGYMPVQRAIRPMQQQYQWLPPVAMLAYDSAATLIDLGSTAGGLLVHRGTRTTGDVRPDRQATLLFTPGTTATARFGDGRATPLAQITARATEFTIGANGARRMPAELPPNTGYTYAVELSVDEAASQGASEVTFDQTVLFYLENFIGFPVGGIVPTGYYDRAQGAWVASPNGRIIQVLGITGGAATVDVNGDGQADTGQTLADLGITDEELQTLASLYTAGQSLWRVPLTHFTPYDCNWPYGPPPDAESPDGDKKDNKDNDCKNQQSGSIIECEDQTLGEQIAVPGTSYTLNYRSDRVRGRQDYYELEIILRGDEVPDSLKRIDLEVEIAGRLYSYSFPKTKTTFTFEWDGRDAYGRPVQGTQVAQINLGYTYDAVYYESSEAWEASFSQPSESGGTITADEGAGEITIWTTMTSTLGVWDARAQGLGGWTLNVHHALESNSGILQYGDGSQRSPEQADALLDTVAGTGAANGEPGDYCCDNGPATEAKLNYPTGLVFDADGNYYVADSDNNRIRMVDTTGVITTFAGTGQTEPDVDHVNAQLSALYSPSDVAVDALGNVFICDAFHNKIRKVDTGGTITTVAGTGIAAYSGDGSQARFASLNNPLGIDVDKEGNLYIADTLNNLVRRVGTDGIITTVVGKRPPVAGDTGDGGPATQARLDQPMDVVVDDAGALYVFDENNCRVRKVGSDGIIRTYAGSGTCGDPTGDGGPATLATLNHATSGALDGMGNLYLTDTDNDVIRKVSAADGIITTVAGTGTAGFAGDGGSALAANFNHPTGLAVTSGGAVYVADAANNRIRAFVSSASGPPYVSSDGREVYEFDGLGRHTRTLDAQRGTERLSFNYDVAGRLTEVVDRFGNTTTIERSPTTGNPTAIVAPGGQRVSLELNAEGYLTTAGIPSGGGYAASYGTGTQTGLLASFSTPSGCTSQLGYDSDGRLVTDRGCEEVSIDLARAETETGYVVSLTNGGTETTSYELSADAEASTSTRTVTDPAGATLVTTHGSDGTDTFALPDGTEQTLVRSGDPRWGMMAPVLSTFTSKLPSGLTFTAERTRTALLANTVDPFTLIRLTDTLAINNKVYNVDWTYSGAGRTAGEKANAAVGELAVTTPEGREFHAGVDADRRPTSVTEALGLDARLYGYDDAGRLTSIAQGSSSIAGAYDTQGRLTFLQNAEGQRLDFGYDAADRLTAMALPSARAYTFGYRADGRLTSVTMPSTAVHGLGYDNLGRRTTYSLPGGGTYTDDYDGHGRAVSTTLPSGRSVTRAFDTGGRPTGWSYPEASTSFTYNTPTQRISDASWTRAGAATPQAMSFTYDGKLVSSVNATGTTNGRYSYDYDASFRASSRRLDTNAKVSIDRDNDGLITGFGDFTLGRTGPGGAVSSVTDGTMTAEYEYDTAGRLQTRRLAIGGQTVYELVLTRDTADRVTSTTETVTTGSAVTRSFTYDDDGQLLGVTQNSSVAETYLYDVNGNRTSRKVGSEGTMAASYDLQDRLTGLGGTSYSFSADGYLTARGNDVFSYGTRGELLEADLGSGQTISYTYDAFGRRVARTDVEGTTQFLYGNPENHFEVSEARLPGGELMSIYYDDYWAAYAFDRGGSRYYVATDHAGSPRVIFSNTGQILRQVTRDSFGRITADTNPSVWFPIGFAGGLEDEDTGLAKFGVRDYDPEAGRFAARDPLFFKSETLNHFVYVNNNPVSWRDPLGLTTLGGGICAGGCLGGEIQIGTNGTTICFEVGVGTPGASVSLNPFSSTADPSGVKFGAEAGVGYGVFGATAGYEVSIDQSGCAKAGPKAEVQFGLGKYDILNQGAKFDYGGDVDWKFQAGGKLSMTVCNQLW
ncbi:MAG: hypothetical protein HYV63_08985 [Candidatus Schekmanbacteria bacterium]|nr:hypothetical protein [Candidatus Schekmanbacteria bacterium]